MLKWCFCRQCPIYGLKQISKPGPIDGTWSKIPLRDELLSFPGLDLSFNIRIHFTEKPPTVIKGVLTLDPGSQNCQDNYMTLSWKITEQKFSQGNKIILQQKILLFSLPVRRLIVRMLIRINFNGHWINIKHANGNTLEEKENGIMGTKKLYLAEVPLSFRLGGYSEKVGG